MVMTQKKAYPAARYTLYAIIGITLLWIVISMSVSVGYNVFWEHKRENAIPDEKLVLVDSDKVARKAISSIRYFNSEIQYMVKRLYSRLPREPEKVIAIWQEWNAEWKRDYKAFGMAYSFTQSKDPLNERELRLAEAYDRLWKYDDGFDRQFNALYLLFTKDKDEITESIRTTEKLYLKK